MKATIGATDFKRLIDATKRYIRTDHLYKNMAHIRLEISEGLIKASALDGHKVSIEYAEAIHDTAFTCYIKPNIPKITRHDLFVELELIENRLLVTVGDNIMGYVQPEITKPYDVDKVIKEATAKEVAASVWMDAKLLKAAVDGITGEGYKKTYIKIEIRDKKDPVIIRTGAVNGKENIKLVLPVNRGG